MKHRWLQPELNVYDQEGNAKKTNVIGQESFVLYAKKRYANGKEDAATVITVGDASTGTEQTFGNVTSAMRKRIGQGYRSIRTAKINKSSMPVQSAKRKS